MADPLSLTASIIAVASVAAQVGKTLKKFYDANDEAFAVRNEITDLEALLRTSENVCDQAWKPEHQSLLDRAVKVLEYIKTKLEALNVLLRPRTGQSTSMKMRRFVWVKNERKIFDLRKELSTARQRLFEAFQLLGISAARQTNYQVDELKVQLGAVQINVSSAHSVVLARLAEMDRLFQGALSLIGNTVTGQDAVSNTAEAESRVSGSPKDGPEHNALVQRSPTAGVDSPVTLTCSFSGLASGCPGWCSCTCHRKHMVATPSMLDRLVGQLLLGYSVRPQIWAKCNEKACRGSSRSTLRLVYVFPTWFLAWSISILISASAARGPEFTLRVPRVRSQADPIWSSVDRGDLEFVKDAFASGTASIGDVTDLGGQILLHVSRHFRTAGIFY